MSSTEHFDVAIVGASIAGCTAATLFAREGLRVALIERRSDPTAYKVLCSHYIQASATPTIQRLGLADAIEAAGGVRNTAHVWTRWGWIDGSGGAREPDDPYGYSIRREVLDPMLRSLAGCTAGVELMLGHRARNFIRGEGRRIAGVEVEARDGTIRAIHAPLVVAADGSTSALAELAGIRARTMRHARSAFVFHFRDLATATGQDAILWLLDPDVAFSFPNDDGITVMALMIGRERFREFNEDPEANFLRYFQSVPGAPELREGRLVKRLAIQEFTNIRRRAAQPGLALIGDAAITSDFLWGMGCGRAFQSAEWLVQKTAAPLREGGDVDLALRSYRRKHRREMLAHAYIGDSYSTGRRFNPIERLMYSAATRDATMARHAHDFARCLIGAGRFLSPAAIGRALWVNTAHRTPKWPELPAREGKALSD